MTGREVERQRSWLAPLVWGLLGASSCFLVSGLEPNMLEEGLLLHVAERLAHGEQLYRDVLAFTGPLPFEVLALLFRLFGEEIWVGRAAVVVLHGAATATGFAIARRADTGPLAHAAAASYAAAPLLLFPLFGIFYYTTVAFHLSLFAIWAALRGERSWRWMLAAGFGVGAVALCKQPIGVALALFTMLAIATGPAGPDRRRALLAFAAGGAGMFVATIAYLSLAGTLEDAFRALVIVPGSLGETFRSPFVNLWPPGRLDPEIARSQTFYLPYFYVNRQELFAAPGFGISLATQLLYAAPLAAVAGTLFRRIVGPWRPAHAFHLALLLTWCVNLFPRVDWGHLAHVLPPALAQLCLIAVAPVLSRQRQLASTFVSGALIACLVGGSSWALWRIHRTAERTVLSSRVPLRAVSRSLQGNQVRSVIDFLGRHLAPGEPIFVARAEPLLYFATGATNPTPYPGVIPGMREEQQEVILEALEKVRYVVMSDVDQPAMTYYSEELPLVAEYLERHFRIPEEMLGSVMRWLLVLERSSDRGETLVDLSLRVGDARAFARDSAGNVTKSERFQGRVATKYNRQPLCFYLGQGGGGLDFDVDVPPEAVFEADVGFWVVTGEDHLYQHPLYSLMRISIGQNGEFTPIAETLAMTRESDWRRWTPLSADLSPWVGQRVTLRLELVAKRPVQNNLVGYFGSPRITMRPTADEAVRESAVP